MPKAKSNASISNLNQKLKKREISDEVLGKIADQALRSDSRPQLPSQLNSRSSSLQEI